MDNIPTFILYLLSLPPNYLHNCLELQHPIDLDSHHPMTVSHL